MKATDLYTKGEMEDWGGTYKYICIHLLQLHDLSGKLHILDHTDCSPYPSRSYRKVHNSVRGFIRGLQQRWYFLVSKLRNVFLSDGSVDGAVEQENRVSSSKMPGQKMQFSFAIV